MLFIVLVFFNITALDFSFSYIINKANSFNTSNTSDTIASDIRKTYYYLNSYYTSFGISYSYSILDYSNISTNATDYTTFKFQTYDLLFELGKEFRNNILSSSVYLGHSSSSISDKQNINYARKDDGPTYAINFMFGRLIQNNKEAKLGFIYRRLDQKYKYDFFGLSFLLRYRI